MPVLNISAYCFAVLDNCVALREKIFASAQARSLKGTVLLAPEGINLFVAGSAENARGFIRELKQHGPLRELRAKESWSNKVPFKRLKVKVKREIIRMDESAVQPAAGRAASVSAQTLKRWIEAGCDDTGRPLLLLDTRNAFEIEQGSFEGAVNWGLNKFTEFPAALQARHHELRDHTVVGFCTGGIRCEKAVLLMQQFGLEHAYQLEGGILDYFEATQGAHFQGSCFVFDEREALQADLASIWPVGPVETPDASANVAARPGGSTR